MAKRRTEGQGDPVSSSPSAHRRYRVTVGQQPFRDPEQADTLGQQLRARREALGLTELDVANVVGYGENAVTFWERDWSVPGTESLLLLAKVLKCRVLLDGEERRVTLLPIASEDTPGQKSNDRRPVRPEED